MKSFSDFFVNVNEKEDKNLNFSGFFKDNLNSL